MEDHDFEDLRRSLGVIERRGRRLAWIVAGLAVLVVAGIAVGAVELASVARKDAPPADGVLRARGLVVVDGNGIERVRIQAPLPDPLVLGKRFPRGGAISGILLSDEEGNERSGYVTSDGYPNVFFTLDSLARQHVLFIAEPQGDPTLRLWDGVNSFSLSVGADAASLKVVSGKETLFEVPAPKAAPEKRGSK